MAKKEEVYICTNCGYESPKWFGHCPRCEEWGSISKEEKISKIESDSVFSKTKLQKISEVEKENLDRFSSGFSEFDRVLGVSSEKEDTGFIKGQVLLFSGEPGVGKSTLLLQTAFKLIEQKFNVLYVSAEESANQIALRAKRINPKYKNLELLTAYNVEKIISVINKQKSNLVVIDSIQTIFSSESNSLPGSVTQVKICASKLTSFAKLKKITLILVGHINKQGNIAGPKVLEHMVDTVFQLEGDEKNNIRILRSFKNRFGPTSKIGLLEMTSRGLRDLKDASSLLKLEKGEKLIGVSRSVAVQGQRPFIIEVQALTNNTPFSLPKRVVEGIKKAKLQRIAAIISKYSTLNFENKDIYLKIAGGMKVDDPAIDLAIAVAIISSLKNKFFSKDVIAMGELDLTGKIAQIKRLDDRIKEAERLGYENIVSSKQCQDISSLIRFLSNLK